MTGDGAIDDLKVTLSRPKCIASQPQLKRSPDADKAFDGGMDAYCSGVGTKKDDPTTDCADVVWEVEVESEDQVTGARVRMRQGFSTRAGRKRVADTCFLSGTSGS